MTNYHNSPFTTAIGERISKQSARDLFTEGYKFHAERIEAKLPRLLAVALLAAKVDTSEEKFKDVASILQMFIKHDVERLTAPQPAPTLPEHLQRWV